MLMKLQSTTYVVMDSIVLEESPSSSSGSNGGGGRAIDRHNPIIRDEKRRGQGCIFPSSSAITTNQSHLDNQMLEVGPGDGDMKRKSVAFAHDDEFTNASDFTSAASSSRCLLSDIYVPSSTPPPPPPPSPPSEHLMFHNGKAIKKKDDDLLSSPPPPTPQPQPPPSPPRVPCDGLKPPKSPPHEPPPAAPSSNQVVVLEVALHCRGCERKMKKHISKIEGVTSFKIEFAAKKVTVVGDVTPLAVLTSVLKVKNAKLLTPATISSSTAQIG